MASGHNFTYWSEVLVNEAFRLAQAAYEREDREYRGLDSRGIGDAVQILNLVAARCKNGRYADELSVENAAIVRPFIDAARESLQSQGIDYRAPNE